MKKLLMNLTGIMVIAGFVLFSVPIPANAADKVIELKFASQQPPLGPGFNMFKDWAAEFEKRTNGRAKITLYFAQALAKGKEIRKAVLKGIADIGYMNIGLDASAYRLNSIVELPFMWPDEKTAKKVWKDLIEKFPEMKKEYKGTRILWQNVFLPHTLHSSKKEIRMPGDLAGMKISAMGTNLKILEVLGASPITLMPADAYMGLERGVADGAMAPYFPMLMLRLTKLLPFHNDTVLNYNTGFVIMSERTIKKLPPDIVNILMELSPKYSEKEFVIELGMEKMGRDAAMKMNHTFTANTPEEVALWKKAARPYHDKWISSNEDRGMPAKAIYDAAQDLLKKIQ